MVGTHFVEVAIDASSYFWRAEGEGKESLVRPAITVDDCWTNPPSAERAAWWEGQCLSWWCWVGRTLSALFSWFSQLSHLLFHLRVWPPHLQLQLTPSVLAVVPDTSLWKCRNWYFNCDICSHTCQWNVLMWDCSLKCSVLCLACQCNSAWTWQLVWLFPKENISLTGIIRLFMQSVAISNNLISLELFTAVQWRCLPLTLWAAWCLKFKSHLWQHSFSPALVYSSGLTDHDFIFVTDIGKQKPPMKLWHKVVMLVLY